MRPSVDEGPTSLSVLVVDDDAAIRDVVVAILRDEGYTVEAAADGAQGLAAMDRDKPCLVLLDLWMPMVDGRGFAALLRERGIHVPIAVMTATRDAQRWCDEIGAAACLPKPFEIDYLVATVARFCGDCGGTPAIASAQPVAMNATSPSLLGHV